MNIVFVVIVFAPKNDPECLQTGKYIKYLLPLVNNLDAVTSADPTLFMPVDPHAEDFHDNIRQKIEVRVPENKYFTWVCNNLQIGRYQKPDPKHRFIDSFKKVLSELHEIPDLVYSRSMPLSSTLLAEKLVDELRAPWVLHLSDPWVPSFLYHREDVLSFHQVVERRCFAKARYITLTTEDLVAHYRDFYPEFQDKFCYITFFF